MRETREQRIARKLAAGEAQKGQLYAKPQTKASPEGRQVGDVLTQLIQKRTGKPPCQINCKATARKMNENGVDWCRDHIDALTEEIHQNIKRMGWTDSFTTTGIKLASILIRTHVSAEIKKLILEACDRCEIVKRDESKVLSAFSGLPEIETRNLVCHIMPHKGNDVWRGTVNVLLDNIELFDGRKVVAVATSNNTLPFDYVAKQFDGHDVTVLHFGNDSSLREVASLHHLLELVKTDSEHEATFYCHSKGVTRKPTDAVHRWRDAMFNVLLDWDRVHQDLLTFPVTGAFKKIGHGFPGSTSDWHYSGTFYWFRNSELFRRNWQAVDYEWWGAESYPSLLFHPREAGCLVHEGSVQEMNLYDHRYWDDVLDPLLDTYGNLPT